MLFEKKHGQHTITLGFEEDSSLQNYENVDGNNRMKALVLFLDSPFTFVVNFGYFPLFCFDFFDR